MAAVCPVSGSPILVEFPQGSAASATSRVRIGAARGLLEGRGPLYIKITSFEKNELIQI